VLENGMPRFFRRLAEGVFDEADLRDRVDELAEFLTAAEKRYQVEAGTWTAIGFSNGANVASALLIAAHLQQPDRHAGAVSTIWRILSARGFVTPQPRERPKSSSPRRQSSALTFVRNVIAPTRRHHLATLPWRRRRTSRNVSPGPTARHLRLPSR
jgi:hypothetical protein